MRPFACDILELALGKLYSYYLQGAYFSLAEVYTGASRWGKTGLGFQTKFSGLSVGCAIPLSESYTAFSSSMGIHGGLAFDISTLLQNVDLTTGASFWYDHTAATEKTSESNDFAGTLSLLWKPNFDGFVSKISLFISFSFNAEPYVANSVFKNVSNYKSVGNANFASVNMRSSFGIVQIILEGEGGYSVIGNYVTLYTGVQSHIPITEHIALRPRFFYYAALNTQDALLSRSSYEFYPRVQFTFSKHIISVGADFIYKELSPSSFSLQWSLPVYYQYSF